MKNKLVYISIAALFTVMVGRAQETPVFNLEIQPLNEHYEIRSAVYTPEMVVTNELLEVSTNAPVWDVRFWVQVPDGYQVDISSNDVVSVRRFIVEDALQFTDEDVALVFGDSVTWVTQMGESGAIKSPVGLVRDGFLSLILDHFTPEL